MEWLKKIALSFLALFLIVEEWLWEILTAFGQWLSKKLKLERVEAWLKTSSPWIALVAFLVPLLIVTPLNILAFWLLARGAVIRAILLELVAKLLGMLLVARVFALTKQQLLTFRAVAWLYVTITRWLHWAHERVVNTSVYRAAKAFKARVKIFAQAFFKR